MKRSTDQAPVRRAITRIEVILALLVVGVAGWLLVPFRPGGSVAARRQVCLEHLGELGRAIQSYLADNDNRWPYVAKLRSVPLAQPPWPALPEVLKPYLADREEALRCPSDERRLTPDNPLHGKYGGRTTWFETEGTSYEWWHGEAYGGQKVGQELLRRSTGFGMGPADQPLLSDFEPFHAGDGGGSFNTLNADLKPRTTRARPAG
jgi:hypothetical protein